VQVTTLPEYTEVYNIVNKLRVESVIAIEGVVRPRPADAINEDMKTGAIEVFTGRCCTFFDFFKVYYHHSFNIVT
jgi:aspartyl-tRNA synthetase